MTTPRRAVTATSAPTDGLPLMLTRCRWRCFTQVVPSGPCDCRRELANVLVAAHHDLRVPGATADDVVLIAGDLLDLDPAEQLRLVPRLVAELRQLAGVRAA